MAADGSFDLTNANGLNILLDKAALIVGATSGIGAECARLFCRHGAKVVIAGRNRKMGGELEEEINKFGGVAKYVILRRVQRN
jgi:NAD(P)-dependent dehydrogenase (short-subunit alcohol dehydrogenase family)